MLIDAVTLNGHNFISIGDIEKIFASAWGFLFRDFKYAT